MLTVHEKMEYHRKHVEESPEELRIKTKEFIGETKLGLSKRCIRKLTSHERTEYQIKLIEETQEELRILMKQYAKLAAKELRLMRIRKWKQICLAAYKK